MAEHILSKEQLESFHEAAEPLVKWVREHGDPHAKVIVTDCVAEYFIGVAGTPIL